MPLVDMRYKNNMQKNKLGFINREGTVGKILPYLLATFFTLNILYMTGILKRKK